MKLALLPILTVLGLSTARAEEQMTVVQQTIETKPPFVIQIDVPENVNAGETTIRVKALDQVNRENKYTKALSLTLFVTSETNQTTEHELRFRKGLAEIKITLAPGSYIATVLNSDKKGRAHASTAIKAVEVLR